MSNIVSFINMKGGVGKTTSSVTLAETCAEVFGWRVLVIDLDAQASASYALCGDARYVEAVNAEKTLATFFDRIAAGAKAGSLADLITPALGHERAEEGLATAFGDGAGAAGAAKLKPKSGPIDVICSEPALRYAERALIERFYQLRLKRVVTASAPEGQTRRIMRDGLRVFADTYDLIVIDCPPGISIFAEAGVACSDLIVMPSIPDYLSTLGLKELQARFITRLRRDGNLSGRAAILRTKVQASNPIHKKYLRELEQMSSDPELGATILETSISHSADIARAIDVERQGEPFKKKYAGAASDLRAFAEEVKGLLEHVAADKAERAKRPDARSDAA